MSLFRLLALSAGCAALGLATSTAAIVPVGVAKVDITPELPIRLAGYNNRATGATKAETPLFARALAIGSDAQRPVVLITVELIGIAEAFSDAVAAELGASHKIERARVAICATHTHTGPSIAGVLPYMFGRELPAEEKAHVQRYTDTLRARLVQVAKAALADRKPGSLAWAEGKVDFAVQRRRIENGKWVGFGVVPEGPIDHALPVLRVTDERGAVRGLFVSYACHCTTLQGRDNFVHSDWAGDAAMRMEKSHAGAVALVAIGCGADANPSARTIEAVSVHGGKVAAEVQRLLDGSLRPLGAVTSASYRRIELPLDPISRAELEKRAAPGGREPSMYVASQFLQQLDAGKLPTAVPYPVQAWSFGNDLAMVFLAGEVVSEYSLRLRRELDARRLWVNSYANSVPCYIPSKRMYPEGGYEVDGSMDFYGWPTRLANETEDRIIGTVKEMVPPVFRAASP